MESNLFKTDILKCLNHSVIVIVVWFVSSVSHFEHFTTHREIYLILVHILFLKWYDQLWTLISTDMNAKQLAKSFLANNCQI